METSDIIKKVRQIEIKSRGLSANIFAGSYKTAFKGHGMSFAEVREYQYGDDVRDIDWNVTARQNKPHIKIFEEERELTVMLLIDVSGSREFGTSTRTKQEQITEIAATLAFSTIQNNDKIGVVFFSDRIEKYIPPQKGKKHVLAIISEMLKTGMETAKNLPDDEYFELILKMIGKNSQPGDGMISFGEKDLGRLPKDFLAKINSISKGKLTLSDKAAAIDAGFILSYGGIEENCSFDAIFLSEADNLSDRAGKLLF